jgi:hypothetical protein
MPTVTATPVLRDRLITEFRSFLCEQVGFVPFVHQAAWWASTDGQELLDTTVADTEPGVVVRLPDGTTARRGLQPRPEGRAKVVAELGAYKSGKSAGAGIWAASFAAVPNATVYLVGNEYDMCVPEFDYLLEALCSERGLNQPAKSIQNRPKDGRLWLELENGARFEARSWERSESLKGKEVDAYIYCEAYQLPGIECFTSVAQNLRVRKGYAVFPTTPDRPWVEIFHSLGHHHPDYADWACHCGIPATVNPYSFDQDAMDRDRGLLTREKFAIAYLGTLGEYVGRVFNYQRGTRLLDMADHPHWWHHPDGSPTRDNFRLPSDWHVEIGADTGTYCAATAVAVTPEGRIVVLDEVTNYAYVANTPELDPESSIVRWTREVKAMAARWKVRPVAWVDSNSQFKRECIHHGLYLQANKSGKEARTEAARQYFQHDQIQVAPWLTILPYELEQARWPDRISAAGKYERLKQNDHVVDCLEHVLSRHPRGQARKNNQVVRLPGLIQWMGHPLKKKRRSATDQHLGAQ